MLVQKDIQFLDNFEYVSPQLDNVWKKFPSYMFIGTYMFIRLWISFPPTRLFPPTCLLNFGKCSLLHVYFPLHVY